jgi:TP901 family phage tail tape measure protein
MADVFAYTITRTNTNVEMLGETMKYAAPVAHAFGASMEETAALAGLMANSGIKASQAGTALRSGLLRLAGPPKQASKAMEALGMDMSEMSKQQAEAQAAMKALGIQLSDTSGPRKMSAIITELRNKMQGLGKEEKLATMSAIFGKNASTGWLAVIDSAPDKFDQLVNEMDKCNGEAERMAKTMNNNAKGAMTRLKSAMESASISLGGVFLPILADAGDGLAKFAGLVGDAAEKHPVLVQSLGLIAVAMTGAALAMKAAGVIYAAYTVATAAATTGTWAFNAALLANPIGLVVVAVAGLIAAGYALYKNWDKVSAGLVAGWEWVKTTAWNFLTSLPEKAGYAVGYVIGWFKTLPERIIGIFKSLDSVGQTFISMAIDWGKSAVNGLIDGFLSLPGRLAGIVSRAWESAKAAFSKGEAAGSAGVAQNASGGIYGKGAFLTTFAENSGESAIPHTPNRRNISLLAKTNEIMGNPLGGGGIHATFAPVINVSGSADAGQISQMMDEKMHEFEAMLKRVADNRRRVSYA